MEAPKKKPENSENQPPLIPPESDSSSPSIDLETLKRLGDENQTELRQQREAEAEKKDRWSDV